MSRYSKRRGDSRKNVLLIICIIAVLTFLILHFSGSSLPSDTTTTPARSINEVIFEEEFEFEEYPKAFLQKMDEKARYEIYFEADEEIQFIVYSKERYDQWKETGMHTLSKVNTKTSEGCCKINGTYKIDINIGEGGTYYFVFDDSLMEPKTLLPSTGKLKITKLSGI